LEPPIGVPWPSWLDGQSRTTDLAILRQGSGTWDPWLRPCSWSWGRCCAHPAGPLAMAGGGADAGCRAACQVGRCRPRGVRPRRWWSLHRHGQGQCAADQAAVDNRECSGDGQEL